MKLTSKTFESITVFVAESSFAEKHIPKAAGFRWHGGNCYKGCNACATQLGKVWWTDRKEIAARLAEFADDAAKVAIAATVETVKASHAQDSAFEVPAPEGLAYRPFQKAGVAYMVNALKTFKGVVNGDDMGLGKTIQTAGLVNADPSIQTVLMICPNTLRINWKREAQKWLTRDFKIQVINETEAPDYDSNFVIVNYDKLVGKPAKVVHTALMARNWDLLVADEAQYLKNPKAQRSVAVLGREDDPQAPGLVSRAKKVLFLTGTPIENRPIEFHPLLRACAPEKFPFWFYAKRFCNAHTEFVPGKSKPVWDFSGASNLEELQATLRSTVMVRRLKTEVLKELPKKVRQVVHLPSEGVAHLIDEESEEFAGYNDEIETARAEVELAKAVGDEDAYKAAVSRLTNKMALAFAAMSSLRHEVAIAKIPYVVSYVNDMIEAGVKKVIVFAHHLDVIDGIAAEFGDAAVVLTGRNNANEKQTAVDRFQTDASVQVFVGQIQAAGVGITLTAASKVVFAELDWVPGRVSQAEDRANRIGQTESVQVVHLVFDGSLDARMAQILVSKQEIADRALDNADLDFATMAKDAAAQAKKPRTRKIVHDDGTIETIEVVYPVATAEERAVAKKAMQILAGRCDGAVIEDGAGFNKMDTRIGKALAERPRDYTDGEVHLAKKLARTYRRQLPTEIVNFLGVAAKV